jgi:hypothetical protein
MRRQLLCDRLKSVQAKSDVWTATGEQIADHFKALEAARPKN